MHQIFRKYLKIWCINRLQKLRYWFFFQCKKYFFSRQFCSKVTFQNTIKFIHINYMNSTLFYIDKSSMPRNSKTPNVLAKRINVTSPDIIWQCILSENTKDSATVLKACWSRTKLSVLCLILTLFYEIEWQE